MDQAKGNAGRVGIIGGSEEYTGAPYFAGVSDHALIVPLKTCMLQQNVPKSSLVAAVSMASCM
jgi:NAD(P)H-hydrate repair Nnr-like enzyme with NAD(P)H-hydrate dehydratase domain